MNRNTLKIIACISMLIDHMGYIMFPDVFWCRVVGRIAMPIFAFFIGEGCLYTRDRKKYFIRVFVLGLICQTVYVIESLITGSDGWGYMNILLTFSISIIVCSVYIRAVELYKQEDKKQKQNGYALLLVGFAIIVGVYFLGKISKYTAIELDYGVFGVILPVLACVSKDKKTRLILFSLGQFVAAYSFYGFNEEFLCSLVSLVLLCFYNGQGGKKNLQYFFYLFYPVHLAVLYLIDMVIG